MSESKSNFEKDGVTYDVPADLLDTYSALHVCGLARMDLDKAGNDFLDCLEELIMLRAKLDTLVGQEDRGMSQHHPFSDPQPGDVVGWRNPPMEGGIQYARTVMSRSGPYVIYRDTRRRGEGSCYLSSWRRWCKCNMPECIKIGPAPVASSAEGSDKP